MRKLLLIASAVVVLATASVVAMASAGRSNSGTGSQARDDSPAAAVPDASIDPSARAGQPSEPGGRPRVAVAVRPGADAPAAVEPTAKSSGNGPDAKRARAASDAEVRSQLAEFRKYLRSQAPSVGGPVAQVLPSGEAVAPRNAPGVVKAIIAAGNEIALTPYRWGGGHGAWADSGYDCSGSVSFALAGAGLLDSPLTSGLFERWGESGEGKWVTIYASPGHVFMYVAGLRFDTSGRGANDGTRWQANLRATDGFTAVHPPGL